MFLSGIRVPFLCLLTLVMALAESGCAHPRLRAHDEARLTIDWATVALMSRPLVAFRPTQDSLAARIAQTLTGREAVVGPEEELRQRYHALESNSDRLTAGEWYVRDPARVERIQAMFPNGQPLENDSWGVTFQDLPASLRRLLSRITDEWIDLWPQGHRYYKPTPRTYHISIAAVQDLPQNPAYQGYRLTRDQLDEWARAAFATARGMPRSLRLTLKGIRLGDDGALIAVFEYEPTVSKLKRQLLHIIQRVQPQFRGQTKPLIHITLFRALDNFRLDEKTALSMKAFGNRYKAIALHDGGEPLSITVKRLHLYHESRWMLSQKDFDVTLRFGSFNLWPRLQWIVGIRNLALEKSFTPPPTFARNLWMQG